MRARTTAEGPELLSPVEIGKRGAIGTALAAVVNAAIALIASRVLPIPAGFEPMGLPRVVGFTLLGGVLATLTFALIQRVSAHPQRTFLRVAVTALLLSFVPDVALLVRPEAVAGTTVPGVLVLMLMHVVAAALIVPPLAGMGPLARAEPSPS